jgi:hypothetical protein
MNGICTLKSVLEVLTALFSIGAAGLWFASAWTGKDALFTPIGRASLVRLIDRIQTRQARFNALAASCAGIAVARKLHSL